MTSQATPRPQSRCSACRDGLALPFAFTMAFQPIVDVESKTVYAYEALARGPNNESAFSVLSQVTQENRYSFDQSCRVKAITLATSLGLKEQDAKLSINFIPGAVYSPVACIQLTLRTAESFGLPLDRLIFEITENEAVADPEHLLAIVREYRQHGFKMALAVEAQEVVPIQSCSRSGSVEFEASMRPVEVVVVQPWIELAFSLV